MINAGKLLPKQALDILCSYAIAEEGTNTLYVGLVELLAQRDPVAEPYTIVELEMTLNYFPHAVWQDVAEHSHAQSQSENQSIRSMRDRFYKPLIEQAILYLDVLSNEQFVSVFQGLCLCGPSAFHQEAFNSVLNSFVERLDESSDSGQLSFAQVLQTFEMVHNYSYSMRMEASTHDEQLRSDSLLDLAALVKMANERFLAKWVSQSEIGVYDLSCLYWIYATMENKVWDEEIVAAMESHLIQAINKEIVL